MTTRHTRRRYYRLTPAGRSALTEFAVAWAPLRDSVDGLMTPNSEEPPHD